MISSTAKVLYLHKPCFIIGDYATQMLNSSLQSCYEEILLRTCLGLSHVTYSSGSIFYQFLVMPG